METLHLSLQKGVGRRPPDLARQSYRAVLGVTNAAQLSARPKTDFRAGENFAHLKLTAEKLVQDQACAKTDLQIATSKLKKSAEQIQALEAKLQDVSNENAKLIVKQKEDAKLWKGLDSKLSSTKALCDQLTETLQHLAMHVQEAEVDKKFFEDKLSERLRQFEDLTMQVNALSLKLESAEEAIKKQEQELKELRIEKNEVNEAYEAEIRRAQLLVIEKDSIEKQLQTAIEDDKKVLESVQTQLEEVQTQLSLKENACSSLHVTQCRLETAKAELEIEIQEYQRKLFSSESKKERLKNEIQQLSNKIVELENLSGTASDNVDRLLMELAKCEELARQEKLLAKHKAQAEFDHLSAEFQDAVLSNANLQSQIQETRNQISELQQSRDLTAKHYAEKEQSAQEELRDTQQKMEQALQERNKLTEEFGKLQEKIACLSCALNEVQKDKEELIVSVSHLKEANQDAHEKAQVMAQERREEIETLLKKIEEDNLAINLRDSEINHLSRDLNEKAQLILQIQEGQKVLEEQNAEIRAQMLAAERTVAEIRTQSELQLEAKQVELTKHLKEISQRNDQEMNDIRRKCEVEMRERIVKEKEKEKQKADALLQEAKQNSEQRVAKTQEEALHRLQCVREEHESSIKQLQREHEKEKQIWQAQHSEEIKKKQEKFEKDLKEQSMKFTRDAEFKIKDSQGKHREEVKNLQDDQKMQQQKAEEQRTLLELQIKILKEKLQQEEAQRREDGLGESLKKEFLVSSTKVGATNCNHAEQLSLIRQENGPNSPGHSLLTMTPDKIRPKVEMGKSESFISIPKHSKKVTQHEYEVATSDGRKTITKRKRTKSTVLFGEASSDMKLGAKNVSGSKKSIKHAKQMKAPHAHPSTIGDLFGGGSLDPYADDPYAFD